MNKEQNIYNYKAPKSSNEETNFFNPNGRINRFAFFARLLLVIVIYSVSFLLFRYGIHKKFGFRIEIFYETVHLYLLPFILTLFTLIQGAKRMHDVNKSGWYFLIPFYNLYLTFSPGTKGNNDYGIDHKSIKGITYFDELETNIFKSNRTKNTNKSNPKDYSFTVFIITVFGIIIIGYLVVQSNKKAEKKSTIDVTSKNIDSTINNINVSNNNKGNEFNEQLLIDDTTKIISNNIDSEFENIPDEYFEEKRDPYKAKDEANVFWNRKYTLYDLITDEPIFPDFINNQYIYKIYYSSNEDPIPYYGEFTEQELENHLFYKFKNIESCSKFCNSKK